MRKKEQPQKRKEEVSGVEMDTTMTDHVDCAVWIPDPFYRQPPSPKDKAILPRKGGLFWLKSKSSDDNSKSRLDS